LRIAVPIWNGRVSPVFDVSTRVVMVEDGEGCPVRKEESIPDDPVAKTEKLAGLGVKVLLCGAVSRHVAGMLDAKGIRVIPFLAGDVDQVLDAFFKGSLPSSDYAMPGCCGRRRGGGKGCGARRRCRKGGC